MARLKRHFRECAESVYWSDLCNLCIGTEGKIKTPDEKSVTGIFKTASFRKPSESRKLTSITFQKFISGQCLEACILGTMFFITMTIFKIPYALLISVLIAAIS